MTTASDAAHHAWHSVAQFPDTCEACQRELSVRPEPDLPTCPIHKVPLAYVEYSDPGLIGELFCNACEDENQAILGPIGVIDTDDDDQEFGVWP